MVGSLVSLGVRQEKWAVGSKLIADSRQLNTDGEARSMTNRATRNTPVQQKPCSTEHGVRVAIGPRGEHHLPPLEQCGRLGTTDSLACTHRWQNGSLRPSLPKVTSNGLVAKPNCRNDFQPTQDGVTSRSPGDIDPRPHRTTVGLPGPPFGGHCVYLAASRTPCVFSLHSTLPRG